jgi:hypothetical protein
MRLNSVCVGPASAGRFEIVGALSGLLDRQPNIIIEAAGHAEFLALVPMCSVAESFTRAVGLTPPNSRACIQLRSYRAQLR